LCFDVLWMECLHGVAGMRPAFRRRIFFLHRTDVSRVVYIGRNMGSRKDFYLTQTAMTTLLSSLFENVRHTFENFFDPEWFMDNIFNAVAKHATPRTFV